jgi:hypothetical protein
MARIQLARIYDSELNDPSSALRWYAASLELVDSNGESSEINEARAFVGKHSK